MAFRNCAPFAKCITSVDGAIVDDAGDLCLAIPMFNVIEYSLNSSKKTWYWWFYSKDEATIFNADIVNNNYFKSFKYRAKLWRNIVARPAPNEFNGILKNAIIAVSLKYLINFGRSLEMPLINCKVEFKLKWPKDCIFSVVGVDNVNSNPNDIIFAVKDTKLNIPLVNL